MTRLGPLSVPDFTGRAAEHAELASALARPPALVMVEGEAGAGKSRLIQEFLATRAEPDRRQALVGICPPFRESQTLGPIVDAVRQTRATPAGLPLSELAGALRPVLPEWCSALPDAPEPLLDEGAVRHRLFRALAEVVDALGATVLVIEDVHWADDGTLEFLLYLAARPDSSLSMIVSYRPEDVPSRSLLLRLSSRLPAGTNRLRLALAPLDLPGTAAMASSMLGGPVAASFARFLHEGTEGLPLAVEESVRLLRNRADLAFRNGEWVQRSQTGLQVPPSVRDSVLERVHRLAPDARAVLRAASVLAEPADEGVVQAVAGLPDRRMSTGLADALTSGLLAEDERGRVRYRHVLMGTAVYEAMSGSERRRLHAAAGQLLEAYDPPPLSQLTRHFRAAGDATRWCRYAELAADQAAACADYTSSVILLHDLLITSPPDAATRVRLAAKMAAAAIDRRDPVDELHSRVIDTMRDVLATPGLGVTDQARLRNRLSRLLMQTDAYDAASAELHAVVDDLDDPVEAARAMTYLGFPYTWPWSAEVHLGWLRKAAALNATLASPADRLELRADLATALLLLGEPSGWETAATLPAGAASAEERLAITRGQSNIAQVAIMWGCYADADRRLALSLEMGEADQFRRVGRATRIARVRLDWLTGQWDGLPARIAELAGPDEVDPHDRLDSVGVVAAQLGAVAGGAEGAWQRLDAVRRVARSRGMLDFWLEVTAALARLQMSVGLVDEALDVTDEPLRTVATKGIWVWATDLAPVRVEALIRAERVNEAACLVRDLSRGLYGRAAPGPRAALANCRALLAEVWDGATGAADAYGRAAAAWSRLPRPYDAQLLRERQGVCLLAAGETDAGLALLMSVHQGLAELGARTDATRVAQLLAAHGVSPRRPWRGGRRGYGDRLSPREQEVVRLVVAGRTNREIAAALSRSPHTIAKQLQAAMRKLGVDSRTALAVTALNSGQI